MGIHYLVDPGNQPVRVVMEIDPGIEREAIAKGQSFQLWRKALRVRHRRVVDEDGNDRNAGLQGARDFEPDKIRWVVDPAVGLVFRSRPVWPDDGHDHLRAAQRVFDVFAKIDAVGNGIEIHEDGVFAELRL